MLVLPAVDVRGGRCVRLIQGAADHELLFDADPTAAALRWVASGARWLHVVDLDGAFTGAQANANAIQRLIKAAAIPVEVGGGMRDLATVERWLDAGAARVILGTVALSRREILQEACRRFGDRIVVGIDARDGEVRTEGWVTRTGTAAAAAAAQVIDAGAPRIIYTDIDPDGTLGGANVAAIERFLRGVTVPVIAAGGVASVEDIEHLRPLEAMGLEGVIVGRALYEGLVRLEDLLAAAA
ncbi:MAG TPA: 1-(5-phosphoribosyl)-5-[(5-phosphoribosylamino)methylideneamino]imidazole-4-carboxamide isomerase [bacterium]|nr:1-(5-phosphoribosyl)-5-[(5-phosphoribosylamino)methylideneamino]imidazole-4-carboxamide isomerase [bacterium]